MDRREFVSVAASSLLAPKFLLKTSDPHNDTIYSGWLAGQSRALRGATLAKQASYSFMGSGKGRIVLLYKYLEKALGEIIPHEQEGQDCVGHAFGLAVDTLAATQIYGLGLPEIFEAKASTEAIYAGSRYEIGYKLHGDAKILRLNGSYGEYAAQYLRNYGVLVRKKYGDIDLTKYDPKLAKTWGRDGVPDQLEGTAKRHPVRTYALVQSYADCRDAIANGYPVILCSSVGFNPDCRRHNPAKGRDDEGFLNKCGKWLHSMVSIGVDDTKRPGLLAVNSWGPIWLTGPSRFSQPTGSFWIDASVVDEMCKENDSYAISSLVGFRRNEDLDYRLF